MTAPLKALLDRVVLVVFSEKTDCHDLIARNDKSMPRNARSIRS